MLGRVVVENGVKKIVPLTADCGSGNPVGTVIAVYSNKVPNGYLPCNGVAFDTAQFPVLYALLQDDHTPDLRECTLVGIGQSDRTMGAHDVYTVGQFKDDQIQNITGSQEFRNLVLNGSTNAGLTTPTQEGSLKSSETTRTSYTLINTNATTGTPVTKLEFDASLSARAGTTTHGKAVGVNWCIKATSGINENQADNVLSALSPVNAVTSGDMHAVTSNAVWDNTRATRLTENTVPFLTLKQGYQFIDTKIVQQGNHYTGQVMVQKTSGNMPNDQFQFATLASGYEVGIINGFGIAKNSRFSIPDKFCYIYACQTANVGDTNHNFISFYLDVIKT